MIASLLIVVFSGIARAQERWDPAKTYVVMVGITEWKSNGKDQYESFPKRGRMDDKLEAQLLRDGVKRENLVLLKDKAATAEAMRREIAAMAKKAEPGSTFIFYFNGHGDKDWRTGRKYLVNYDLDPSAFQKTGFEVAEIGTILDDNLRSGRVLLLGDCCYSGALADVVRHFSGSRTIKAASLSSVVSENMAWATNSYSEDLVKIFAGDGLPDRDHKGKLTLRDAATFLSDEMRFRENQPTEVARTASFEPDFVLRDVDPTTVLRTLPGRWQLEDFVDAKSDGHWYRAQIKDEKDGRYKVHLFAKTYDLPDEWVDAAALRQPAVHDVAKGDKVSVRSTADWLKGPTWFDGVVTAVKDGFARVRYDLLPAFKAEWVPTNLLHYGEDRAAPPVVKATGLDRLLEERIVEQVEPARTGER